MNTIKECIICGSSVSVHGNPELVACKSEQCQITIENSIGLHYSTPSNEIMSIEWDETNEKEFQERNNFNYLLREEMYNKLGIKKENA